MEGLDLRLVPVIFVGSFGLSYFVNTTIYRSFFPQEYTVMFSLAVALFLTVFVTSALYEPKSKPRSSMPMTEGELDEWRGITPQQRQEMAQLP